MKKLVIAVLSMVIIANIVYAGKLFDYRGVFPADRSSDAKITNYMLLKKAAKIRFEIEDQKQNPAANIMISQVKLTSDSSVVFSSTEGIKELELPETGIYEITLSPKAQPGVELRFVLRVVEISSLSEDAKSNSEKADRVNIQSRIGDSWKPEPPVATAAVASIPATVERLDPRPVTDNNNLTVNNATQAINMSEAQIRVPTANSEAKTEARPDGIASDTVNDSKIVLLSPQKGFFLNTLNGIRLSIPQPMVVAGQYIPEIFNRGVNGAEIKTNFSFFSPEPGVLAGFPEKVVPGSVYHLRVLHNSEVLLSENFAAFPDLSCEFTKEANVLKILLKWPRIETLMANPAGQVISLNGCEIQLHSGEEQLMQLEINDKLLPIGLSGKANYRANLFELEFSLPAVLVQKSGCRLEIMAPIDGNPGRSPVFSMSWQDQQTSADDDENHDFSDVEAIYSGNLDGRKKDFAEENVIPLKQLDLQASFQLEKSFSILENSAEESFAWPQDLNWDNAGRLWVLDSQKRRVLRFTSDGNLMKAFSGKGSTDGLLDLPVALAVNNDNVFISDSARHAIHKFSIDGSFVGYIKNDATIGNLIDLPAGICFRKDEMWVADRGNGKILCFNPQGGFLGSFSSTPSAPIISPVSIRADADSLFILEKTGLVKKFSPMGSFDATFQTGCRDGLGFDVDAWGTIWVCDAEKFQVLRFSSTGGKIAELASPPAPKPWLPTAVAVRVDGKIAVADAQNKMVHIYSPVK